MPEPVTDDHGFIRVECPACQNPDVWFTCNGCKKSDGFVLLEAEVRCRCGATYTHGICTCGQKVERGGLRFVPASEGPLALADLEIAWDRVALFAAIVVLVLGAITYAMFV